MLRFGLSAVSLLEERTDPSRGVAHPVQVLVHQPFELTDDAEPALADRAMLQVVPHQLVGVELRRVRGGKCSSSRSAFASTNSLTTFDLCVGCPSTITNMEGRVSPRRSVASESGS